MFSIVPGSGANTTPLLSVTNGIAPNPNAAASSYLIEDYNGDQFDAITSHVVSDTDSDLTSLLTMIMQAINTNTEVPTDFYRYVLLMETITLVSTEKERVTGTWSITPTHSGTNPGDIMFGDAVIV